ncbi:MAG: chromosome segregation protein SMC [Gammaproteobacteria bacterium HGW-Gammaproteobacteria-10]|nr:MAG: chromosome segregation protein SMC [Gammaproteobacteria bacterium HGW-Gammaproteobacteria-10]
MKLEKIKLSGFKSFVDPTVIPIAGNLTAIVGPNGCGKSNIIDAVRWVMGESSAKHLRGGSMVDVIFNGSASRKPVGTASVELIFDNSEGKAGGEFAKYNTISIKRQVSRDGQSLYALNNARCRRKDITDLFLGTGLGSRSYAIIEQGTISRMVEAKPEDLRVHIEEAAGVSKYKERRQETESRMQHTRENLERLTDLRDEVEKQLKHLQKQAEKAEKYTGLKQQERQFKLELLAMRWDGYHQSLRKLDDQLREVAEEHNRLFVAARETDAAIEAARAEHKNRQAVMNRTQGDYYQASSEVGRLEQTIKLNQKSHEEIVVEIDRLRRQLEQSANELENDQLQLEEIKQALFEAEETLALSQERAEDADAARQRAQDEKSTWQQQWEVFLSESSAYREQAEIERLKIKQLDSQNRQLQARLDKLQAEQNELTASHLQAAIEDLSATVELLQEQRDEMHGQLEDLLARIQEQRRQLKQSNQDLHGLRSELHGINGKISSLELLQQHAMGKDNKHLAGWLAQAQLTDNKRLAELLEAESGWEHALETVLGTYLEAICVEDAETFFPVLQNLTEDSVTLFQNRQFNGEPQQGALPALIDKVKAPLNLDGLLTGIYCADDLAAAKAMAPSIKSYESIILPDGTWLGCGWLRIIRTKDSKTGVLQREKELRSLKLRQSELQQKIEQLEERIEDAEQALKDAEAHRETWQREEKTLSSELSAKSAELSAESARHEQQQRRLAQVRHEIGEIVAETAEQAEMQAEAELKLQQAEQQLYRLDEQKQALEEASRGLQAKLQTAEARASEIKQQVFSYQSKIESLRSSESLTTKQIERLSLQNRQAGERIAELEQKLVDTAAPIDDEKILLQQYRNDKERLEKDLKAARKLLEETEQTIAGLTERHSQIQRDLEKRKASLDKLRFEQQECQVRRQTITEQLNEIDAEPEHVLEQIPEDANEEGWKSKVDTLATQIDKLGAINLSAIDEYQVQSERLKFLDDQHADLTEALDTLTQAINKIDKESRQRFRETFDKINSGLQEKFPKLFGGGQAYLELTEVDVLEAGVNIIARPPGKRNSSIHLLSGGEKALTAVALVFSIFELNPAPFCLLDEVDAPLDDANVGRFSKMVEEMSAAVQFLFISHNKVTMEIAKQLAGVTMREPGVSRMVAVDIEEAMSLAES